MTKPLPLTDLQREILTLLTQPNTRLRWHSYATPAREGDRGRGQILGVECRFNVASIAALTMRSLIRRGFISPATRIDRQPFKPGVTHRDYTITGAGRAELEKPAP